MRLVVRLTLLVLSFVLVVVGVTAVRVVRAGRTDAAPTGDVILVLGAAQYDGRPQEYLLPRLQHALELFHAHAAPRLLTVGGKQPGDRFTEAQAGRDWLVEHGVPAADVVAVGEGTDTLASVRAGAQVMDRRGWGSAVVVTDPWHLLRSTSIVADQGVTAYGSPVTTGPSVGSRRVEVTYVARETAAYLAYEARRALT